MSNSEFGFIEQYRQSGSPEVLITGGAYVLTQETERLARRLPKTPINVRDIGIFNKKIADAVAKSFPSGSLVVVGEQEFYARLSQELAKSVEWGRSQNAEVINVDRFIDSPYLIPRTDYSNLSIGRIVAGNGESLTARPTELPVSIQLETIARKMNAKGISKIIIVDDGFASPESLEPYIQIAQQMKWTIVGFTVGVCPVKRGAWAETINIAEKISGNPVQLVLPTTDPIDWTCQRDFTIFGGKMIESEGYALSTPYFYPFSNGSGGSIPPEQLMTFSMRVLEANAQLIASLDNNRQTPLTFSDALAAGYGIPASTLSAIRTPKPEERISEFIQEAIQTL